MIVTESILDRLVDSKNISGILSMEMELASLPNI